MKNTKNLILVLALFTFSISYAQNGYNSLGQKNGPWYITVQGVKVFEGTFKNGVKEGSFKTYYHGSGKLENLNNFLNNKFNGIQKTYSESGVLLWQATYINGVKTGIETKYYDNGKKKSELTYTNSGELEGNAKVYDESGSLIDININVGQSLRTGVR